MLTPFPFTAALRVHFYPMSHRKYKFPVGSRYEGKNRTIRCSRIGHQPSRLTPNVVIRTPPDRSVRNTQEKPQTTSDLALDRTLQLTDVPNLLHQISTLCEGMTKERLKGLYTSSCPETITTETTRTAH